MPLIKIIAFNRVVRLPPAANTAAGDRGGGLTPPIWEGRSRYPLIVESSLIHSARVYRDGEHEAPGFRTIFCPAAGASDSSTEVHVSEEEFDEIQDQLASKLIEIEYSLHVEPYRQGDGLRTGEGIGTPTKRVHINAALIQSVTYCKKPDAEGPHDFFRNYFTVFMPPSEVDGAPLQLHVEDSKLKPLLKFLEAHQLASNRCIRKSNNR